MRRHPACSERDKTLAVRIDAAQLRSVSRRTSVFPRTVDAGRFGGLHGRSFDVGARLLDGLPNRISRNANVDATLKDAVVAGIC